MSGFGFQFNKPNFLVSHIIHAVKFLSYCVNFIKYLLKSVFSP